MNLTDISEGGLGDILKVDKIMKLGVHEIHVFLAHRIDKQKLVASIRKKTLKK